MHMLTAEEKWWPFLGKISCYSAPALALLNRFEPCPSQNPGYTNYTAYTSLAHAHRDIMKFLVWKHYITYKYIYVPYARNVYVDTN